MAKITYTIDCANVDWAQMKEILVKDNFDNLRTPEQYRISFENSYAVVIVYEGKNIIGTARALSDGVCNAYIVDVWTYSPYRKHGIATTMMSMLTDKLQGQHVYLWTDDVPEFYRKIGYTERGAGFEKVVGEWLENDSRDT